MVAPDTRRKLFAAFVRAIESGPLATELDPKPVLLFLSTNAHIVLAGERVNLGPLWNELIPHIPEDQLFGLFLRFAAEAETLGLPSTLPEAISSVPEEVRVSHMLAFATGQKSSEFAAPQPSPPSARTPDLGALPGSMPGLGPLPGASMPGLSPLPGASMPGLSPLPGASMPGLSPLPGASMPGLSPLPGAPGAFMPGLSPLPSMPALSPLPGASGLAPAAGPEGALPGLDLSTPTAAGDATSSLLSSLFGDSPNGGFIGERTPTAGLSKPHPVAPSPQLVAPSAALPGLDAVAPPRTAPPSPSAFPSPAALAAAGQFPSPAALAAAGQFPSPGMLAALGGPNQPAGYPGAPRSAGVPGYLGSSHADHGAGVRPQDLPPELAPTTDDLPSISELPSLADVAALQNLGALISSEMEISLEVVGGAAFVDAQRKEKIISSVVRYLRASPAGRELDVAKLQYFLDQSYATCWSGERYDFGPVWKELLSRGASAPSAYIAFSAFSIYAATQGILVTAPNTGLDETIQRAGDEAADRILRGESNTPTATPAEAAVPASPQQAATAEFAVEGQASRKRKATILRIATSVILGLVLVVVAIAIRPFQSLDVEPYRAVFPIAKAQLLQGTFVGHLDHEGWKKLSLEKRHKALKDLTEVLRKNNRLPGASVLDVHLTKCIFDVKNQDMYATTRIMSEGLSSAELEKLTEERKSKQ
ncbi:MAG: hypothetical protein HYV07_13730 [Deltaproteobacteria bacterium]|nr:hypothetical protein [Deltaproteobacteria bacterium]